MFSFALTWQRVIKTKVGKWLKRKELEHQSSAATDSSIPVRMFLKASSTFVESKAEVSMNDRLFFSVESEKKTGGHKGVISFGPNCGTFLGRVRARFKDFKTLQLCSFAKHVSSTALTVVLQRLFPSQMNACTCKGPGLVCGHSSEVAQVTLVADQHDDNVVVGMVPQLLQPAFHILVCQMFGYVIH